MAREKMIRFSEGPYGGSAASVLSALCSGLDRSTGNPHREMAQAAVEIAQQVSPEWVSCVRSHLKPEFTEGVCPP